LSPPADGWPGGLRRIEIMRKLKILAAVACVLAVALPAAAQVTNVQSDWSSGNLVWKDKAGNIIATFDGTNRKIEVPSGAVLDLDAATTTLTLAAGTVARAALVEDALQTYGLSVFDLRQTTGIPLVASETAGNFNVLVSANVIVAQGEITDNETEVSVTQFQFTLPPEYVAGQPVQVAIPCQIVKTGAAVDNGSTIDVSAYWQLGQVVGADIVTTAAQTFAAMDQSYVKVFSLDPALLVPGYTVNVVISASIIDSEAGAGTLRLKMDAPYMKLDIKG
jgi:hypothetical protein